MQYLVKRYVLGFSGGLVFGFFFPSLVPFWILTCSLVCVFIGVHLYCLWGFGGRHYEYYPMMHVMTSGVAVAAWVGIMFGNKSVGKMLIFLGGLIS